MPVYEFECERGHVFEMEMKVSELDAIQVRCQEFTVIDGAPGPCHEKCRRLISRTSFTLKGKGWAKDGYGG